jgi:hypothetical protein
MRQRKLDFLGGKSRIHAFTLRMRGRIMEAYVQHEISPRHDAESAVFPNGEQPLIIPGIDIAVENVLE